MQDCIIEFNKKKLKLGEKIRGILENKRGFSGRNYAKCAKRMDTKAREEYERDKLSFMKQTDAEEKRFLTEYLLKFEGEDTNARNNKSKNLRGQPSNRRRSVYLCGQIWF